MSDDLTKRCPTDDCGAAVELVVPAKPTVAGTVGAAGGKIPTPTSAPIYACVTGHTYSVRNDLPTRLGQ